MQNTRFWPERHALVCPVHVPATSPPQFFDKHRPVGWMSASEACVQHWRLCRLAHVTKPRPSIRSGSGSSFSSSGAPCRSTCAKTLGSCRALFKCGWKAWRALTSAFSRSSVGPSDRFARWPLQMTTCAAGSPNTSLLGERKVRDALGAIGIGLTASRTSSRTRAASLAFAPPRAPRL